MEEVVVVVALLEQLDIPLKNELASPRQMGHVRFDFSHLSTHLEWNSWLQGRIRSVCRTSKSHMQTTQVV
jgi:hypothetical protein